MSLCLRDPTRLAASYCVREMFMGYMELCALIVSHLGVTEDGNVHLLFIFSFFFCSLSYVRLTFAIYMKCDKII